jgi:uncharacterized protein (TIGR02996 family)
VRLMTTKPGDLLKAWQKQPNEALRALILAHDEREPLEALRHLEQQKTAVVIERLDAFKGAKAKDPRLTRALEELVVNSPWSADSSKPVWRAIFDTIARTGDVRFTTLAPAFKVRPTMQEWLQKQFAAAIAKLPAAFPASDETKWKKELAALPAKKVSPGAKDEAGLFANVYANPHDDAPRLVLADFLTEKGDPRGEFISMQFAAQRDLKREKALLKQHGKKWLGVLAPVVGVDVEFERGFPARGLVKFKSQRDVEKFGHHPEWATFEALTWSTPGAGSFEQRQWYQFLGPAFRHLRSAVGPWLPQLLASKLPFERLEHLDVSFPSAAVVTEFVASKNFPKLHTLGIDSQPQSWFTGLKRLAGLKTLRLSRWVNLDEWLAFASSLRIDTLWHGEMLELHRNADGVFARATVHVPSKLPMRWFDLTNAIPDGALESVEFTGEGELPADAKERVQAKVGKVKKREVRAPDAMPEINGQRPLVWLDDTHVGFPSEGMLHRVDVSGPEPKLVATLPSERFITSMLLHPDGTLLLSTPLQLLGVDPSTGEVRWKVEHKHDTSSTIDLSRDGKRVGRGKADVIDLEKRAVVPPPKGAKDDTRTPDDEVWIRWVSQQPYELRRPGQKTGIPLEGGAAFRGPLTTADGLVACTEEGLVKWDPVTGKQLALVKNKDGELPSLPPRASANRRFVVVPDGAHDVVVATLPDLKPVGRAKVKSPQTLAVTNDGKRVAVVSDGKLRVVGVK